MIYSAECQIDSPSKGDQITEIRKSSAYLWQMPTKKTRTHSEETKQKISQTRKLQEEIKRLALAETEKELTSIMMVTHRLEDIQRRLSRNLSAANLSNMLKAPEQGRLREYSELGDRILEDGHIRSLIDTRAEVVAGKDIFIEPADKSEQAEKAAAFIRSAFDKIPMLRDKWKALLDAVYRGISVLELIWQYDPKTGTLFIADMNPIPISKLQYNSSIELEFADGEFIGKTLCSFGRGKFVIHSANSTHPFPIRKSLLPVLAWLWYFKGNGWVYYSAGLEKTAYPMIYATVPSNADPDAMESVAENLQNLLATSVAVLKGDSEINTVNNAGASVGNIGYDIYIKTINSEITKLIAGGNLVSDIGSQGSRAAAEVHERRAMDKSIADGEALAETIRAQIILPLIEENLHLFDGIMPPLPKVWFDLREYRKIDELIVKAGLVTKNQLLAEYGLPLLPSDQGGDDFVILPENALALPLPASENEIPLSQGRTANPAASENGEIFSHWMTHLKRTSKPRSES